VVVVVLVVLQLQLLVVQAVTESISLQELQQLVARVLQQQLP
jgi:hypothetical protein